MRWKAGIGLVAVLLLGSGCSASSTSVRTAQNIFPGIKVAAFGLIPANPVLQDSIELKPKQVQAGGFLTATLVIVNDSEKTINLSSPCRPWIEVALANKSMRPDQNFRPPQRYCSRATVLVRPGTTHRYLGMVQTTYPDCTAQAGQQVMQCLPDGKIPPLPAGRYYAVLVGDGLALPLPTPVPVDLTAG
jgi:hypothetical protein